MKTRSPARLITVRKSASVRVGRIDGEGAFAFRRIELDLLARFGLDRLAEARRHRAVDFGREVEVLLQHQLAAQVEIVLPGELDPERVVADDRELMLE